MATRGGPKPKPAALKVAQGTLPASAVNDIPSGEVLTSAPQPPLSLEEAGVAKWNEWGPRLAAMKLLEDRFLDALEMYCRAWDRLAYYEGVLAKQGEFFVAESGYVGRHPAANGAKQARDEIRRYQQEFGLTPSAASSVKVTVKTATTDKRKRFFGS